MPTSEKSRFFIRDGMLYKSCPSCSRSINNFVYYTCPEYFGLRYDGTYSQSLCYKCRTRNTPPSYPFEQFTLQTEKDILIPDIRILPISKQEYDTYDKCLDFLNNILPNRQEFKYYYKRHNMITNSNAMILFQYNAQIVAYGFYKCENSIDENHPYYEEGNRGYYEFVKDSIYVLNTPITHNQMKEIFDISLGQGTQRLSLNYLPKLLSIFDEHSPDIKISEEEIIEKEIKEIKNFSIIGVHQFSNVRAKNSKKDYVRAHINQMNVGKAGERLVLEYEKKRLINLNRSDLAEQVNIVSEDSSLGYDIKSFDDAGNEIYIEVKTKSAGINYLDFYITDNEYNKLKSNENHIIYYISQLKSRTPLLFKLYGNMLDESRVVPVLYRVSLDYIKNEDSD